MFASLHTSTMAVRHVQSRGTLAGFAAKLRIALTTWQQRQQILALDADRLADIGLTHAQAEIEAGRSFWDVPTTGRR